MQVLLLTVQQQQWQQHSGRFAVQQLYTAVSLTASLGAERMNRVLARLRGEIVYFLVWRKEGKETCFRTAEGQESRRETNGENSTIPHLCVLQILHLI